MNNDPFNFIEWASGIDRKDNDFLSLVSYCMWRKLISM